MGAAERRTRDVANPPFATGMRIGPDHIASTIYTIVFRVRRTVLAALTVTPAVPAPDGSAAASREHLVGSGT